MQELSKSIARRLHESNFVSRYFVGEGIDIGSGDDSLGQYTELFPLVTKIRAWDKDDGDAQEMTSIHDDVFDFVHSSHCLEHMVDPGVALSNWLRILKPNGYLVIIVPDEDMYEKGRFPSVFNPDHKWTFTLHKDSSWSPNSRNLFELLSELGDQADVIKLERLTSTFRNSIAFVDQTLTPIGECAIEVIIRKRTGYELNSGGEVDSPQWLARRADTLRRFDFHEKAVALLKEAAIKLPISAAIFDRLGASLAHMWDFEASSAAYQKALSLGGAYGYIYYSLGRLYEVHGYPGKALEFYKLSAGIDSPMRNDALASASYMHLMLHQFDVGWEQYESRLAIMSPEYEPHILNARPWHGERDKVVLVYPEQGFGDALHMVRYAHLLKTEYNCKVYLQVQPALVKLLKRLPSVDYVFCPKDRIPTDIEYAVPMMSLPLRLGLDTKDKLDCVAFPYLTVEDGDVAAVRAFLPQNDKLKVGLCWFGGQRFGSWDQLFVDRRRNITLGELEGLATVYGVSYVSLQLGPPAIQVYSSPIEMLDTNGMLSDFYDTACLISCLDLVITVDTSVAHLAAALNKPVLLLSRLDACWRWGAQGNTSFWYPSIRIFRQEMQGDWKSVAVELREALVALRG